MTDAPGEKGLPVGHATGEVSGNVGETDDDGRVGPFPNWTWVYSTVVVYGVLVIVALLILTRLLNF